MTDKPYHYGTALMLRRKQLGLTQQQVSEATGIAIRTISSMENGEPQVAIGRVNQVRQYLGMNKD